jgi:uncharacterized protein
MKRSFFKIVISIITLVLVLGVFLYFENNAIGVTELNITSKDLPSSFDGFKIVQLSDLHSKSFGEEQNQLISKVKKLSPDLIVFTGDLVDSKRYDEQTSLILMEKLVKVAPVYFVTGNHEWWSGKFSSLEQSLEEIGVKTLRNAYETIEIGNDEIHLVGIDDPAIVKEPYMDQAIVEEEIKNSLKGMRTNNGYKILLSHRPEMFELYTSYNFDLIFSGHAHGGQVRLPFIGGLVAPNQGYFPKYTAGLYKEDGTAMVVSRGLGNSIIPQRIFNRPEIIIVTLSS